MANLRDRGYSSSMDNYNQQQEKKKRQQEERKKTEAQKGPVSTQKALSLPKVNSTANSRAASQSAQKSTLPGADHTRQKTIAPGTATVQKGNRVGFSSVSNPYLRKEVYGPPAELAPEKKVNVAPTTGQYVAGNPREKGFPSTMNDNTRPLPEKTEKEFYQSPLLVESYGNYYNYSRGRRVTKGGYYLVDHAGYGKQFENAQAEGDVLTDALDVTLEDLAQKEQNLEDAYRNSGTAPDTQRLLMLQAQLETALAGDPNAEKPETLAALAQYEQEWNRYEHMDKQYRAEWNDFHNIYARNKARDEYKQAYENATKMFEHVFGKERDYTNLSNAYSYEVARQKQSVRTEEEIRADEDDLLSRIKANDSEIRRLTIGYSGADVMSSIGLLPSVAAAAEEQKLNVQDQINRLHAENQELYAMLSLVQAEKQQSKDQKWEQLLKQAPYRQKRDTGGDESIVDEEFTKADDFFSSLQHVFPGLKLGAYPEIQYDEEGLLTFNSGNQLDKSLVNQMTPEERQNYKTLSDYYDQETADAYAEYLTGDLNARLRKSDEDWAKSFVNSDPLSATVYYLYATLAKPVFSASSLAQQWGEYLSTGEITKDAAYNQGLNLINAGRGQTMQNVEDFITSKGGEAWKGRGEFGMQVLTSILDNLWGMAIAGSIGGGDGAETLGSMSFLEKVRGTVKNSEDIVLGLMGTSAAADATISAVDRGLDSNQAMILGTGTGLIEILTEKIGLDALLESFGNPSSIRAIINSTFSEGGEEVLSGVLGTALDCWVAQDQSEFRQKMEEYKRTHRGASDETAAREVWKETLEDWMMEGAAGAASGFLMSGVGMGINAGRNYVANRNAITKPSYVNALINSAKGMDINSEGYKAAQGLQNKIDNREKISYKDVRRAQQDIQITRGTSADYVNGLLSEAEKYDNKEIARKSSNVKNRLDNGSLTYGNVVDLEHEVNKARATSSEYLSPLVEIGKANAENSPAYKAAVKVEQKLKSGQDVTLREAEQLEKAANESLKEAFDSGNAEVIGSYMISDNGARALTDAATILKNSTSQSDIRRGNEILQAIQDGNLDARTAGEVFLRSQKILENTRNQNIRVLKPREVTADMDAYDRSAAELGVSEEEASHNKAILQAFGVEGEYKSFENNNLSAYYDRSTGKVYINANAQNPGLSLIAHEVTHSFENTAGYKKLADLVFSQSEDLNADLQRITQEYADAGIDLDDVGARSELVSEFVEQHMFNDEKFIKDVVSTDRSLGQKILRTLDNLLAKLGNKNARQRQLLREARDLWAEALQQRKTSDKAKAKIAEKRGLTLPAVEAKAAAVRKAEGPNLPKAESRKIQTANAELNQYGINIDADSGAVVSYSIRTAPTTVDEIKLATDRLVNAGFDRADAENWLKSLTSVSSVIMQNMLELDYEADERYTWLKTNSEYTQGSVDFNNNCPKRAQFTAVFDRLQQMMPDRVFSASDYETIRQILIKHNISVTCGPCFVEDRRQHTGEIAQKFIDQLKSGELKNKFQSKIGNDTYIPTQYDLVTYEGLRGLYDSHRGIHDAFVAFNNARGMQAARLLEGLAEYNNQIKKWNKRTISSKNSKGGLRIFSLSDADPRNMIDMIQIVTDSAEKGLMIQGYTKKPWFARFIKDTGVRILRSHIPAGSGVRNGKLVFDNVEGINTNDPDYFDATNERNIGDTVIGINDEMIRIAMLDPSIDQIIPFHTQLAKDIRDQKKIGHWTPYNGLEDRNISDGKKADKQINIYMDVLQAWEKKGTPITNRQEFVEAFLQVCDERGLIPRFDKFLNKDADGKYVYTPGYEKFLVDYKLFDRATGEIIPQEAIKPIFDDAYNQSVLENYVKGAKNLPKVSENVFDEIKRHFTDGKLSLPKAESKQFSISKSDTAYLQAVESGDMETAQRMVDEAARKAGYSSPLLWHGTMEEFNEFKPNEYLKEKNGDAQIKGYFSEDKEYAGRYGNEKPYYVRIDNPLQFDNQQRTLAQWQKWFKKNGITNVAFDSSIAMDSLKGGKYESGVYYTPIELFNMNYSWNEDGNLTERIRAAGYDGMRWDFDEKAWVPFNSEYIKSADPITYDDQGNVIPLSERFNPNNPDIRYAINKDATIRTESELIDSIIDPKETAKAGVQDAVDAYIDSVDMTKEIPGRNAVRTSSKSRAKANDNGRFLYRKMVDSGEAVDRLGIYSNDLLLYPYYNMARASSNAAISMIQNAQTDVMGRRVGDSLNDIFSAIRAKGDEYYSDLQLYLYHLHNIARMSRANPGAVATAQDEYEAWRKENPEFAHMLDSDIKKIAYDPTSYYHDQARQGADIIHRLEVAQTIQNKPIFGYEVSAEVSRESAARLREKLEQTDGFEEDVEKIRKYIDNLMQYRIDSGLFTEEQYEKLKKIYPDYVPVFYEYEVESKKGRKEKRTEVGSTVGRAQGVAQETPIMPLHKALAQQTMSAVREGSKNRFGQRLLEKQNLSRNMIKGIDTLLADFNEETFDQPDAKRQNAFVVRQNGKRYEMTLGKDLYEAIDVLSPDPQDTHKLIEIYHKAFDLFKAGVTGYNPVFAVKNPIRDLQDAGLYSKDLSEFLKQYPKTAGEIRKNGKYWQLYQAMGGLYSSVFDYEKGELEEHGKLRQNTLDRMESLNMAIEQMPRLAEFMATIKKAEARGEVTMDDLMEAAHNAADVTVNFGRSGKWGRFLNRNVLPFFNPGIQGADKFVRRFTETKGAKDWLRLTGKAALFGILPAILNKLLWGKRKDWDELKQSDRDNYYLFPIPWKDGVWLRLPKGRALALFGMATDRLIQGKDADWASFITTGYSNLGPSNPLKTNFLSPILDSDLFDPDSPGKTWYGGDIESQRLQNLAPGERYDAGTDAISKWLGKTFNLSPKKINYILDQYTGVIGDIVLPWFTEKGAKGIFTNAFTVDSVTSNRLSSDFYEIKDELTYAKNSPDSTSTDAALYKFWNDQTTAISEINKKIREIEEDKNLSNSEKLELTRAQTDIRNGLMRAALDAMKDYKAGGTDNPIYSSIEEAQAQEARENATYTVKGQEVSWDDLTGMQKKIATAQDAVDKDKNADLTEIIGKGNATKKVEQYQAIRSAGISNQTYLDAMTAIDESDDGNGNYNQGEVQAGLDQMISDKKISQKDASAIWQTITGGKNNPYTSGKLELPSVQESKADPYADQTFTFKGEEKSYSELTSRQQKIVKSQDAIKANPDADLSDILIGEDKKATKLVAGYQEARAKGISNETYLLALTAIDDADNGDGNYSQKKEVNPALQELVDEGEISSKDASTIWKIITGGADKNNPFPVGAIMGLRLPKIG